MIMEVKLARLPHKIPIQLHFFW